MSRSLPWTRDLPDHWNVLRGDRVAERVRREPTDDEGVVTAFRDGQVTLRTNRRTEGFTEAFQEIGYQGIRRGDLVIHGMDAFAGAIGVSDSNGKASPVVHAYSGSLGEPRYLAYVLRTAARAGYIQSLARGIRERSTAFDPATFKYMNLPVPPLREQLRIADFLDRETAQIDALIEKQEVLIGRVAERRDVLWESMYKTLASENPSHAVRRLVHSVVDGPFGSSLTSSHYEDEGVRVIRLGNIGIDAFKNEDKAFISEEYGAELSSHQAVPGDVVMAGLGDDRMPLGRAAVVPEDIGPAIVKADCYRLRPRAHVLPSYLSWALSSPPVRRQILDLARGATRARLNTGLAKMVRVTCPPPEQQEEIIVSWSTRVKHLDDVTAAAVRFIKLARERRAALITVAVTGQLDIANREAA